MGWFWKTKREKQLEAQLQTARDEASSNWGARMTAESDLKKVEKERDTAQESLSTMSARVEALSNERDAERKAKEQAQRELAAMEKSRDHYRDEVENRNNRLETVAAEKRSLIADRDGWKEEKDKQDVQNGLLHKRIKTLLEEKEAQRLELVELRDKVANWNEYVPQLQSERNGFENAVRNLKAKYAEEEEARPVIEVEVYDSKQGRKAQPCKRFVARHAGVVVAVSPPQGTNDDAHARERITLLSQGKWVIVQRKEEGDGKA